MTRNDPLSDALSGLRNAEDAGELTYRVSPASSEIASVLDVFEDHGYLVGYDSDGDGDAFEVELHGAINACGAVTPRYTVANDGFERWEKRYLPARGYGTLVVSTSRGVMSHAAAREAGVGGQVVAYVY
jgi:small subunit ribosomal protein S8